MTSFWLSVIIPTYNGGKYLESALESVVQQQDNGVECIVIDDGSTDNTLEIIRGFQDKLNLKLIAKTGARSWVTNTNHGLSQAQGKYACFLHQDDLWLEGRLETLKQIIVSDHQASLYLHDSIFIDQEGKTLGLWRCPISNSTKIVSVDDMTEKLLIQNFIAIPSPIFNRQQALDLGGLDSELWYTADWDFWLKLASAGKTYYIPKPLAAFRIHGESQTIRRSSSIPEFRQQMRTVVDKYLHASTPRRVVKTAFFSIEVNTTLAAVIHGQSVHPLKLVTDFLLLGPPGWYRYWQDSRIQERVFARLKAKF